MSYPFTVLRVQPDRMRAESVNIGLLVFLPNGKVMARLGIDTYRLRALDSNLARLPIFDNLQEEIETRLNELPSRDMQTMVLRDLFSPVVPDSQLGNIEANNPAELEERLGYLMTRLIKRPTVTLSAQKQPALRKTSKLNGTLRDWFKQAKILSRKADDLPKHKVVANYPISAANDLYAEFALKNGEVHVIETVDLRRHDKMTEAVRKEAAIKSIILDQAKEVFGQGGKRIAVVAADDYAAMRPALGIVTRYADDIVAIESNNDKQRLADFIQQSLHMQETLPTV